MKMDWESSSTEVLLNPRIPEEERKRYSNRLLGDSHLKSHVWVTTSGTTGRFKFVALSKEGILCSAQAVNEHLCSTSSDIWLHALPDFHVGGIGIWARGHLCGAEIIDYKSIRKKWNPHHFQKLAEETKATLTALVPTQVFDLVDQGLRAPSSLRTVVVGGGALSRGLYDQAQQLGWKLLPSYGLTECASQVATAEFGQFDTGTVLPHVKLKIDSEGFICIQSLSLLTTYAYFEGEEVRFLDPKCEGWFITEDKGELHENTLKVFGRGSDFVKISGESVNLRHLQLVLEELKINLKIRQDMVLSAVPDERSGHILRLIYEGNNDEQIDKLIERYQEKVMPYERIQECINVEKIPRLVTILEK